MVSTSSAPTFEKLQFDDRYYEQTAKSAIESIAHVIAEAGTNEDEAIWRRAKRDGTADTGQLRFEYDPDRETLTVVGDGDGMTSAVMRKRLRRVGADGNKDARRGFFHRGIREVFIAMGGGRVRSIGQLPDGRQVISEALFKAREGMAMIVEDAEPTAADRAELGLAGTGTAVEIPVRRFVRQQPNQFEFSRLEGQLRDCVGLRTVLTDSGRDVQLVYGNEPPKKIEFTYPKGEDLISPRDVEIAGQKAHVWVKVAEAPIKGPRSKQTRRSGLLVRGERAAYEVTVGDKLASHPAMPRIFGEIRIDAIEELQRKADETADEESQLIYKTDRSGLNPAHPLTQGIYDYIDQTIGPLVADLDSGEEEKNVSPDMRRQLNKLARAINQVVKEDIKAVADDDPESSKTEDEVEKQETDQEPPDPPEERQRVVADGIGFAHSRIFVNAGESRTVEVWFDGSLVPTGAKVSLNSPKSAVVSSASLAAHTVPVPGKDGVAAIDLTIHAGNTEGRHEIEVGAAAYSATLAVHVRFPRAGGFISNIVPKDVDWELGSALYYPSTGVVEVFVGRQEFKDAAARAKKAGDKVPWRNPLYRTLVVESVREAALWPAAERHAEVAWDELPAEERQGDDAWLREVRTAYQELDYKLRAKLLKVFVE